MLGAGNDEVGGVRVGLGVGKVGSVGLLGTATGLPFVHVVQPVTPTATANAATIKTRTNSPLRLGC